MPVRLPLPATVDRAALLAWARARPGAREAWLGDRTLGLAGDPLPPLPDRLPPVPARDHRLPVRYDGEDLAAVAERLGLAPEAVAAAHAEPAYVVRFLGFRPGFAYLDGLPPALRLPRRATPRPRVPGGAVAVGGPYTGVYPAPSPGGWHLLGTCGLPMFDPAAGARLAPGDRVRFVPGDPPPPPPSGPRPAPDGPGLVVERVLGACTVQDLGRPGHLAEGVPAGGAMVPERLVAANRAHRNPDDAPALELHGALRVRARGTVWFAGRRLRDGEALELAGWGRYLALRGGVAAPLHLGGRGTLPGLLGLPALAAGDVLLRADLPPLPFRPHPALEPGPLRVAPGPDLDRLGADAWEGLLAGAWRVGAVDRTGTRLAGPPLPIGPDGTSEPAWRGAVEVSPDGRPLVLGPDHPTTTGYPVLATVIPEDHGRLGALAPGDAVRFVAADPGPR